MNAPPNFDLSGKVALVTGSSRGLGQAIAVGLAQAGATVGITARDKHALAETASMIADAGGTAFSLELDVRDVTASRRAVDGFVAAQGYIDILVNNAGYEEVCPSLELEEATWDSIVDTNLKGAFFCAQSAARHMAKAQAGGAIINVCSLTSYVGIPTAVPYGSSKSGLLGMTRALAAEWAEVGVRVNAIAPGYFRTAMTDVFYEDADWQSSMLTKIPMRSFGDANDLKGAVVFLASEASHYITGQCIGIDGGYLASI